MAPDRSWYSQAAVHRRALHRRIQGNRAAHEPAGPAPGAGAGRGQAVGGARHRRLQHRVPGEGRPLAHVVRRHDADRPALAGGAAPRVRRVRGRHPLAQAGAGADRVPGQQEQQPRRPARGESEHAGGDGVPRRTRPGRGALQAVEQVPPQRPRAGRRRRRRPVGHALRRRHPLAVLPRPAEPPRGRCATPRTCSSGTTASGSTSATPG